MSIATLNPWQVLDQLQKDALRGYSTNQKWHPAVDIFESKAGYNISIDLPGAKPEDVKLSAEDNKLKVTGERKAGKNEGDRQHYSERVFGSFQRSFQLPKDADQTAISAEFDAGVLTIQIPKREETQPRNINIQIK